LWQSSAANQHESHAPKANAPVRLAARALPERGSVVVSIRVRYCFFVAFHLHGAYHPGRLGAT
jgi:hypothetical protein